jgi:hypothetical protein
MTVSSQVPPATSENLRQFKRWMRDVLRRPFTWEAQREAIKFEDPADPAGFIEVICDAEKDCSYKLQDLNRRIRYERQKAQGRQTCIDLIMRGEESMYLDGRMRWLQASRQHSERQQQRCGAATGLQVDGGGLCP